MDPQHYSRVMLLYGGYWSEGEISIASAQRVAAALRTTSLTVTPVRWGAEGWVVLPDDESNLRLPGMGRSPLDVLSDICADGVGVVFNCLHGGPGEDGTVQGLFELAGVAYTGAGVHGSATTYNKASFRFVAAGLGCQVAPAAVIHRQRWAAGSDELLATLATEVGIPSIIKPVCGGSSLSTFRAEDGQQLGQAIDDVLVRERSALIERFIPGREVSVALLGTRHGAMPQVLPVIEIEPSTDTGFFDTEAKYVEGRAEETCPAQLDADTTQFICERALALHRELDLGGMSRTDIIIGADGPVFLESNTIPGLTDGSLLPQCAAASDISFSTVCRRLIDYALSAHLARSATAPSDAGS